MVVGFRSDSTDERFEETVTLNAQEGREIAALKSNEERQEYLLSLPQAKAAFSRAAIRAAAAKKAQTPPTSPR